MTRRSKIKRYPIFNTFRIPPALTIVLILSIGLATAYSNFNTSQENKIGSPNSARVCFSPGENCEDLILHTLLGAKDEILVQAYSFTSKTIAKALVAAKKRGVSVLVVYDEEASRNTYSVLNYLRQHGIVVLPEKTKGLAHNKILIVDKKTVITGSYNFTNAARDRNSENVLSINDETVANAYRDNWIQTYQRSRA